jgi:hypothetical protein
LEGWRPIRRKIDAVCLATAAFGDHQPLGNSGVGPALRHEAELLALARAERPDDVVVVIMGKQTHDAKPQGIGPLTP